MVFIISPFQNLIQILIDKITNYRYYHNKKWVFTTLIVVACSFLFNAEFRIFLFFFFHFHIFPKNRLNIPLGLSVQHHHFRFFCVVKSPFIRMIVQNIASHLQFQPVITIFVLDEPFTFISRFNDHLVFFTGKCSDLFPPVIFPAENMHFFQNICLLRQHLDPITVVKRVHRLIDHRTVNQNFQIVSCLDFVTTYLIPLHIINSCGTIETNNSVILNVSSNFSFFQLA